MGMIVFLPIKNWVSYLFVKANLLEWRVPLIKLYSEGLRSNSHCFDGKPAKASNPQ